MKDFETTRLDLPRRPGLPEKKHLYYQRECERFVQWIQSRRLKEMSADAIGAKISLSTEGMGVAMGVSCGTTVG